MKRWRREEKRLEARDGWPEEEEASPLRLVFFALADRVRQLTARGVRCGGGDNGKNDNRTTTVSWGTTSGSEWREQGEWPAAVRTT